ncbi:hypothetical protein M405DRAFT_931458 [Rhizopogon salebrosus TDB-379]|nr:hypothetical protein M405DRAFT_931458 [Rhizopogon salebrosus TDB-379]
MNRQGLHGGHCALLYPVSVHVVNLYSLVQGRDLRQFRFVVHSVYEKLQEANEELRFPHHLSYKPRYSSPALPLRISVVGGSRRRVFISPFFATLHSSELHVQCFTPSPALVFSVFYDPFVFLSLVPAASILPVTFDTNLLSPRRTTDVRLDALDGFIYSMRRFRTCASHIKGLTADILISVAKLVNGWKRVYGRYPSNLGSGHADDEGKLTKH